MCGAYVLTARVTLDCKVFCGGERSIEAPSDWCVASEARIVALHVNRVHPEWPRGGSAGVHHPSAVQPRVRIHGGSAVRGTQHADVRLHVDNRAIQRQDSLAWRICVCGINTQYQVSSSVTPDNITSIVWIAWLGNTILSPHLFFPRNSFETAWWRANQPIWAYQDH